MLLVVASNVNVEFAIVAFALTKAWLPRSIYPACVPVVPLANPVTFPVHWLLVGANVSSSFPVLGAALLAIVTVPVILNDPVFPGQTEAAVIETGKVTPM
jgi:hypothetical protein